jgi:hypothetical protein|tara:strand:+ start:2679 stop:2840 length:162 start_codon:yes stop_codon:yes gene_type:complete
MQTILVLITFLIAAGYLLKKFVWNPLTEKRRQTTAGTLDGGNTKCGKNDCGCH